MYLKVYHTISPLGRAQVRHGVFNADFSVDDMELETLVAAKAKAASHGEPGCPGGPGTPGPRRDKNATCLPLLQEPPSMPLAPFM